jgi:hypothetical protein
MRDGILMSIQGSTVETRLIASCYRRGEDASWNECKHHTRNKKRSVFASETSTVTEFAMVLPTEYRYATHKDVSVNDGPHIRLRSHNIIILTIVLQLPTVFSTVTRCTGL